MGIFFRRLCCYRITQKLNLEGTFWNLFIQLIYLFSHTQLQRNFYLHQYLNCFFQSMQSKQYIPIIKCTEKESAICWVQLEWHLLSSQCLIWVSVNVICWFYNIYFLYTSRLKSHLYIFPFYDTENWNLISETPHFFSHNLPIKFRTFNHSLCLALEIRNETWISVQGRYWKYMQMH